MMGKLLLTFTMSLDGFIAGPEVSVEQPMGKGGERLHEWIFNDSAERGVDPEMAKEMFGRRRRGDPGTPHLRRRAEAMGRHALSRAVLRADASSDASRSP